MTTNLKKRGNGFVSLSNMCMSMYNYVQEKDMPEAIAKVIAQSVLTSKPTAWEGAEHGLQSHFAKIIARTRRGSADDLVIHGFITRGIPGSAYAVMQKLTGLSQEVMARSAGISRNTVSKRIASKRLPTNESAALFKMAEAFAEAALVLEDADVAKTWMSAPNAALGNQRPLDLLETTAGERLVYRELAAIEHGLPV